MTSDPPRRALWLCADELRSDSLGCYGNHVVDTPNIDRLAAGGIRYDRHVTATAPCGPARTSLLTGLYQLNHRVTGNRTPFDPATPTIATMLAEVGVPSYLVGYTDTVVPPYLGGVEGVMPGLELHAHFNLNPHGLGPWLEHLHRRGYPRLGPEEVFQPRDGTVTTARYGPADSDTAYVADRTIDCIRQHAGEPWLIFATFLRPHPPWVAPEPYGTRYRPDRLPPPRGPRSPRRVAGTHPYLARRLRPYEPEKLWARRLATERAVHHGLVDELDHHVGRVLRELDSTAFPGDTLVVLTSDHGTMLGDHWLSGSGGVHRGAYEVPLIVRPSSPSSGGTVVTELTSSVDLVPSLLRWFLAPPPPHTDGRLLPVLLQHERLGPARVGVLSEYDYRGEPGQDPTACDGDRLLNIWHTVRHRYVHFVDEPPLLFDLRRDADEQRDLLPTRLGRTLASGLAAQLLSHRMRHADQGRPRQGATAPAEPEGQTFR